jgi:hypothetical protein
LARDFIYTIPTESRDSDAETEGDSKSFLSPTPDEKSPILIAAEKK